MTPDVVHVACKLPGGLRLHAHEMRQPPGHIAPVARRAGEPVVLRGTAYDRGVAGAAPPELFGGYAVTLNVPRDVWDSWAEANAESAYVARGIVFADADLAALKRKAAALGHTRSGMEPSRVG